MMRLNDSFFTNFNQKENIIIKDKNQKMTMMDIPQVDISINKITLKKNRISKKEGGIKVNKSNYIIIHKKLKNYEPLMKRLIKFKTKNDLKKEDNYNLNISQKNIPKSKSPNYRDKYEILNKIKK